jgi:hypothetical protein
MGNPAIPGVERRAKPRYPIDLVARHRTLHKRAAQMGAGHTVNLSSHGMLVAAPNALHVGEHVRVSVDWPKQLDGHVALQLVVEGRVVRCDPAVFAIAFHHYEFRTERKPNAGVQIFAPQDLIDVG